MIDKPRLMTILLNFRSSNFDHNSLDQVDTSNSTVYYEFHDNFFKGQGRFLGFRPTLKTKISSSDTFSNCRIKCQ
jgi:hypothetical protein